MANDDKVFRWDDVKAQASTGAQAQAEKDTVKIQVRVPRSWQEEIDRKAGKERLSRSEYLRRVIGRDALQSA